jgi:hypothetical protein
MEDFISEFAYIVLSILVLVFTALGNKKKKAKYEKKTGESLTNVDDDNKPFNFEDLFAEEEQEPEEKYMEERFEEPPAGDTVITADEKKEVLEQEDHGFLRHDYPENPLDVVPEEDPDSIESGQIKSDKEEMEKIYGRLDQPVEIGDNTGELSSLEDFELEKAIIYSEIIKPKYF